ncbi:hypothetical protein [Rhizobium sp. L245/93]|uniref:hypothetical protein n=1 Tax=Rhizobium sp. L245/93 TaxID=2819998 RepID=UPI001ADB40FD|nr:hypothetical protein [Rhizobium sp. L245/93]MBO9170787.1 hypothetical protein [Rhizobium sp. L245/93]
MKRFLVAAAIMGLAHTVSAQEAVVGADNPDALFTSSDPKYAKDPSKSYTTTWFDSWRFVDGKADEHWDPATKSN